MKGLPLLGLALCFAGCGDRGAEPHPAAYPRWLVRADSVNFAVLIVDYDTYAFEGGTLSYYAPCAGCAEDCLPMRIQERDPVDFGWILFSYAPTADTLFAATVIWMGDGRILYPHAFAPPDSFETLPQPAQQPACVQRFQFHTYLPPEVMAAATDSAWSVISSLDLVHALAGTKLRLGYYLYAPTAGFFQPQEAKWVVFLCRGNE